MTDYQDNKAIVLQFYKELERGEGKCKRDVEVICQTSP